MLSQLLLYSTAVSLKRANGFEAFTTRWFGWMESCSSQICMEHLLPCLVEWSPQLKERDNCYMETHDIAFDSGCYARMQDLVEADCCTCWNSPGGPCLYEIVSFWVKFCQGKCWGLSKKEISANSWPFKLCLAVVSFGLDLIQICGEDKSFAGSCHLGDRSWSSIPGRVWLHLVYLIRCKRHRYDLIHTLWTFRGSMHYMFL